MVVNGIIKAVAAVMPRKNSPYLIKLKANQIKIIIITIGDGYSSAYFGSKCGSS